VKKWKDNGYWISKHYYWQSMVYVLYNAIKYRSLTFFSACNPALSFGGMLADDKTEAYNIIPKVYLPLMFLYDHKVDLQIQIDQHGLEFPVIVKPNMGYKGFAVRECRNLSELEAYIYRLELIDKEWLIQEYIDKKCEYSIMYYCVPGTNNYGVTSICKKEYPCIAGDGKSTISQLIDQYENAFVNKDYIKKKWESKRNEVPKKGNEIQLHHIGNYSRGSKFHSQMNENDEYISTAMHNVFNRKKEIYFCRLDIKADSLDEVRNGNFKIIEINGAKSEPLHIYDSEYGFWNRIRAVRKHWKLMTNIVDKRRKIGNYQFPGNIEGLRSLLAVKRGVK
jgi:D-alanine-D-alanine ligase-like ATP-grasp enzyme